MELNQLRECIRGISLRLSLAKKKKSVSARKYKLKQEHAIINLITLARPPLETILTLRESKKENISYNTKNTKIKVHMHIDTKSHTKNENISYNAKNTKIN